MLTTQYRVLKKWDDVPLGQFRLSKDDNQKSQTKVNRKLANLRANVIKRAIGLKK